MNEEVLRTVRTARQLGEQQFKAFLKERLEDETNLKTNNRPTYYARERKVVSKNKAKITVLKEDLFSRLYIAYQNRDGNLEDFFKFENQTWPPSLSLMRELRGGTKVDLKIKVLVRCLQPNSAATE